jgi:hypothetical protein
MPVMNKKPVPGALSRAILEDLGYLKGSTRLSWGQPGLLGLHMPPELGVLGHLSFNWALSGANLCSISYCQNQKEHQTNCWHVLPRAVRTSLTTNICQSHW